MKRKDTLDIDGNYKILPGYLAATQQLLRA